METAPPTSPIAPQVLPTPPLRTWWVVALMVAVVGLWIWNTPEGVLGKADAVGYAICHRIDTRSFTVDGRQLPLCARCTGIYLGVLVGLAGMVLMGNGRAGRLPRWPQFIALFGFIGIMGVDGVNSYLTLFPGLPHLYEPNNTLRVITGTFNGLALAGLMFPAFNQTLWANWVERPVIGRWRDLGMLVALAVGVIALVLTDLDLILYPLAVLSAVGVVVIVMMLNTTILLMALRQENRVRRWTEAIWPLLAAFTLAIVEIGLVDAGRFAIFQSWSGFVLPR